MTDTCKLSSEMVKDVPKVLGMLLRRFERDIYTLTDFMSREEQDRHMWRIGYVLRNHLMINESWTHEMATAATEQYKLLLRFRLTEPEVFNPALRPRQLEGAPTGKGKAT